MNYGSLGGLVMTCGNPFNHMLENIMVEMFDSPYLWKIRDDKEWIALRMVFALSLNPSHGLEE